MARLRFPGRPGCRADRVRIPFCADDVVDSIDPAHHFVSNLRNRYQEFNDVFGESEDEEFEGFTEEDVRQSNKKVRAAIREEHKTLGPSPASRWTSKAERHRVPSTSSQISSGQSSTASSQHKPEGVVGLFGGFGGQASTYGLSREEILQNVLAAKQRLDSLKAKHKHALHGRIVPSRAGRQNKARRLTKNDESGRQRKSRSAANAELVAEAKKKLVSKRAERKSGTYQTPKVRPVSKTFPQPDGEEEEIETEPFAEPKQTKRPLHKDRSKSVVRQLLQKAKQGGSRTLVKVRGTGGHGSQETSPQKRVRNTFVLPKFSRSRRAIIPTKRFIEDDPIPSALLVKRPRTDFSPSAVAHDLESSPESGTLLDGNMVSVNKVQQKSSVVSALSSMLKDKKKKSLKLKKSTVDSSLSENVCFSSTASDIDFTPTSSSSAAKKSRKFKPAPHSTPQVSSSKLGKSSAEEKGFSASKSSSQEGELVLAHSQESVPSADQLLQLEMSPVVAVTPHKMDTCSVSGNHSSGLLMTAPMSCYRKGLLEQPLIVEGKRQRVPSLKVRLTSRQSEDSNSADCEGGDGNMQLGEDFKQTVPRKEQFSLFPKASASAPKTFNRAGPMKLPRRDKDGKESFLTKRSGQIMLRKAKLQLNRTALNRSKAALARSLKAQLKREARQKGRRSEPLRHSPRPGVTSPLSISVMGSGSSHPFDSPNSQPSPLMAGMSPGNQGGFASPARLVSSLSPISLPSKKEPVETASDQGSDLSKSATSRGPRIKHVCRRAAMVLPMPRATFPAPPDPFESPTLSALPSPEKERLLQSQAANREEKDSSEEEEIESPKPSKKQKAIYKHRLIKAQKLQSRFGRIGKRRNRCKECKACLAPNCGKCVYCLDSKKFGGKNVLKKACINRTCERPRYSKQATDAFIQLKNKGGKGDEVDSSQVRQGPSRMARPAAGFFASLGDSQGEGLQEEGEADGEMLEPDSGPPPRERVVRPPRDMEAANGSVIDEGGLEIMSAVGVTRPNLTHHARRLLKRKEKSRLSVRLPLVVPEPQPLLATSALWSVPPNTRSVVHPDMKDNFLLEMVWSRGLALTFAGSTCVRAVCYLCGSAGREKLLYCSICCEPFHPFCLEVEDRPLEGSNLENWCCRRCQFCHVCGLQSGLLQCDRCQDTYHPECLGPAYPKQPSRRNVWVCTKCVRCKSCGATTPGSGNNATWTYDFSLCFDCGKLMDKGNFCPICRKCYADDDWESKMVQCGLCDSWVHARCEGLTDEMYQFFSFLPEDIQYRCRVCSPTDPPEWRTILHEELMAGLRSVLNGLTSFKCSHHLLVIDQAKEKERTQRALLRKKNVPAICNTEAVRSSPRVTRTSRSNPYITPDKPIPETDDATGRGVTAPVSQDNTTVDDATANSVEKKLSVDGSLALKPDDGEDCVKVLETSDNELCSSEKRGSPNTSGSCDDDESTSSRISQEKAAKMSNVGIFERVTKSCALPLDSGTHSDGGDGDGRGETDMESTPRSQSCLSSQDHSSLSLKSVVLSEGHLVTGATVSALDPAQKYADIMMPDSRTATPVVESDCSEVSTTTPQTSDTTTPAAEMTSTASLSVTEDDDGSSSTGVSRNLFDAFMSIEHQKTEEKQDQGESPSSGCCGRSSDTDAHYDCEKKEVKVDALQTEENSTTPTVVESTTKKGGSTVTDILSSSSGNTNATSGCERTHCTDDSRGCDNPSTGSADNPSAHDESMDFKEGGNEQSTRSNGNDLNLDISPGKESSSSTDTADSTTGHGPLEQAETGTAGSRSFTVNMVTEDQSSTAVVSRFERRFPRDFCAIRMKLDADKYMSVEEFNEDMVHIIQTALSEDELFPTRRKHNNSVKSIFIKQMERVFPWFNVRTCQLWLHNRILPHGILPDAVVPPSSDHTYAQWQERETIVSSSQLSPFKRVITAIENPARGEDHELCQDMRQCALCLEVGDDYPGEAGRLLYAGQDDWVHVNCALWSAEVFEEADGSLQNVHVAMVRGRQLRCNRCQAQGATVGCFIRGCPSNYHFLCARRQMCLFKDSKKVYCYQHKEDADIGDETQKVFAVRRRVCIDMADVKCMKKSWARGLDAAFLNILFGSCTVENLGCLAPLSDCKGCLLPLEFSCSRVYWSTVDARRRTVYTCRIIEVKPTPPSPEMILRDVRVVHDERHPEFRPLDSLDLPSMGLSHLLRPVEDVVFVSQTSPQCQPDVPSSLYYAESVTPRFLDVTEMPSITATDVTETHSVAMSSKSTINSSKDMSSDIIECSLDAQSSSSSDAVATQSSSSVQQHQPLSNKPSLQPAMGYCGLAPSTLKLLNIKDPKQLTSLTSPSSSSSLTSTSSVQEDLGNLTGMVARLNNAAMHSKRGGKGQQSHSRPGGTLRNKRCNSEERLTFSSAPVHVQRRRAGSLSPVSFSRAPSPFNVAVSSHPWSLLRRALSPSEALTSGGGAGVLPLQNSPIPEQLENELIETGNEGKTSVIGGTSVKTCKSSSTLVPGKEMFVDLTIEEDQEESDVAKKQLDVGIVTCGQDQSGKESVVGGDVEGSMADEDDDVALAEQVLSSVPKEILESSEVKVLVIPGGVSEEEAIELAKEALLQQTQEDCVQQEPPLLEESKEIAGGDVSVNSVPCAAEGKWDDVCDFDSCSSSLPSDSDDFQIVGEVLPKFDISTKDHVLSGAGPSPASFRGSILTRKSAVKQPSRESSPQAIMQGGLDPESSQVRFSGTSKLSGSNQSQEAVCTTNETIAGPSITSSLKMARSLAVAPVYDKRGNLIGQRKHRPYVVETVQTVGDSIDIQRHHGMFVAGVPKLPKEHFRLPLSQKPLTKGSPLERDNVECKQGSRDRDTTVGDPTDAVIFEGMSSPADSHSVEKVDNVEDALADAEKTSCQSLDVSGHGKAAILPPSQSSDRDESACIPSTDTLSDKSKTTLRAAQDVVSSVSDSSIRDPITIDSGLKLPEDVDASRLRCSVSVHKLHLDNINTPVSVKNMEELRGSGKCISTACSGKAPKISVSALPQSDSLAVQDKNAKAVNDPQNSGGSVAVSSSVSDCMKEMSITVLGQSKDLWQNSMNTIETSSKACEKLCIGVTTPAESDSLDANMSVGEKPLCNGLDEEEKLQTKNSLCSKDSVIDMALHPPCSDSKPISEALRTVECRVSLERLSGSSSNQNIAAETTSNSSCSSRHERDGFGVRSRHNSATDSIKRLSASRNCSEQTSNMAVDSQNGSKLCEDENTRHEAGDGVEMHEIGRKANDDGDTEMDSHTPQSDRSTLADSDDNGGTACIKEDGDSLPLHTEIALRIKAESLARSSPGESGPFKCPTCKRLYRTADSFRAHAQSCDFDVSTSDDEDEGEEDKDRDCKKDDDKKDEDKDERDSKQNLRTSLRQSTLTQRKAMESSQLQLALQAAEKTTAISSTRSSRGNLSSGELSPRGSRGKSRRLSASSEVRENHQLSSRALEPTRRTRRQSRRSSGQSDQESCSLPDKPLEQLSPKESMLGAVGLVSKTCLETQTSSSKSPTSSSPLDSVCPPYVSTKCPSSVLQQSISGSSSRTEMKDNQTIPVTNSEFETLASSVSSSSSLTPIVSDGLSNQHSQAATGSTRSDNDGLSTENVLTPRLPVLTSVAGEDSDHDSDVVVLDDIPTTVVSRCGSASVTCPDTVQASSTAMTSTATGGLGVEVSKSDSIVSTSIRDGVSMVGELKLKVAKEKHRTTSPILSRLGNSLQVASVSGTSSSLQISVADAGGSGGCSRPEGTAGEAISTSTPPFLSKPGTLSSGANSSFVTPADIDSDDLSFTDSEDDTAMDTDPPPLPVTLPPSTAKDSQIGVNINRPAADVSRGEPRLACSGNLQQTQTKHLLSVLDKLSPTQKMILTQQLLKKGALSIEEPIRSSQPQPLAAPPSQSLNNQPPHSAVIQSSKPIMMDGSGANSYLGQHHLQAPPAAAPQPQQFVPGAATLRIVGSGLGGGQLTLLPQQEGLVVRQQPGLTPTLVTHQQTAQGSLQILHPHHQQQQASGGGIVVRGPPVLPVVPVSSLPSHMPFAPSPAAGLSASSLAVSSPTSSLGAAPSGILSVASASHHQQQPQPTMLCQQNSVLNATSLNQALPAGGVPSQRVGYMGSFLVDPSKAGGTSNDQKARLQLLSLIQNTMGVVPSTCASPASLPGVLTSVVGSRVASSVVSQPANISQQPRLIRVVVEKQAAQQSDLNAGAAGSGQHLLRIVKMNPSAPSPPTPSPSLISPPPPQTVPPVSFQRPSPSLTPVASFSSVHPVSAGQEQQVGLPVLLEAGFVRKRPAFTMIQPAAPSSAASAPPPTKRPKILPAAVESNGILPAAVADHLKSSSAMQMIPPAPRPAAFSSSSLAPRQVSKSSEALSRSDLGVHVCKDQANTALAGIRKLLKKHLPEKAKKRTVSAATKNKMSGPSRTKKSASPTKVKLKPKTNRAPIKKKQRNKGGPLSHPIVHLSHQAGAILPQAEVEEEIRDTPLKQNNSQPPSQQSNIDFEAWPKDMPRLAFEITSDDGFSCRGNTMEEVWRQVTDKVQDARAAARMKQLSYGGVNGVQMFGVGHEAVVYLLEQLAGAPHCRRYKFKFQNYEPPEDEELLINPLGSARCTPFSTRKPYDIFSFLMSRHRQRPMEVIGKKKEEEMEHKSSRRATSMELPMAMRFRKLQEHAKEAVGVYRSKIHGRGLFCKRSIDNGEMVIEYSGEIIRSSLTDKREKYYESKGIGCYMFRIDDFEVVDATMHGSAARFINHSCEPNCYSKVISVDGKKHIVIFASRAIKKGEELTYDYKFPIEEVKIPCTCGSRRCRKYLN